MSPASSSQQRLWFLDQLRPRSAAYNLPLASRLQGPLDVGVLSRALEEIVARHESLRTTFSSREGVPVQVIASSGGPPLAVDDLSALRPAERDAALSRALTESAARPFDLQEGPLFRAKLVRLAPDDHVLLVNASHIIADGSSLAILFRELSSLYAAFVAGRPSPLSPVSFQFAEYARWQRELPALERLLGYWRERLSGEAPSLELPSDRRRPEASSGRGRRLRARLATPEAEAALAALCREERTSAFSALLAAFALVLQRYTAHEDVVVGSPFGNRSRAGIEGEAGFSKWSLSIGFYAATLVLRVSVAGDPTFRELVRRARAVVEGAAAHVDVPFEKIVEALRPTRDAGTNPFFQIMIGYMAAPDKALALPGVTVTPVEAPHDGSMFDLFVQLEDARDGLTGAFTYSTDLYDEQTIERLVANYAYVIAAAVAAPDAPVSRLATPAPPERRRVLAEWNETSVDMTPRCIHEEIQRQVGRTPGRVAVRTGDRALTYEQLDERANHLARRLEALGVRPEGLVGLCLPRGPDLVVAVLATLKAGGAYLPLDPTYPATRLAQMIEDSRVAVIVTVSSKRDGLPLGAARALCLDAAADAGDVAGGVARGAGVRPENLAYVIYTSGSTGTPKGVMVEHRQVSSFFVGMDRVLGAAEKPGVWLAATSLSFDISVLELLWTLARGFTVIVQPDEDKVGAFAAAVTEHAVTHFQCTPSMAGLLLADEADRAALGALEVMLVGGEALSPALARELTAALRGELINMYGPTETTIWSSSWRVDRQALAAAATPPISIGRPIANTMLYVLDAHREPVPIGAPGELYIGGAGVSRGYLGRPDLTNERFIPNPFGAGRLYRTGDLCRYRGHGALEGNLEFLGRVDHQVKIRGHRVELAEIELVLRDVAGVRDVVVAAAEDPAGRAGDQRLVAYLAGPAPPAADLRRLLRERLPEAMVPSAFVVLEKLPFTPNGKVDRAALPAAAAGAAPSEARDGDGFVAPRTPTERVVSEIWCTVLGVPRVSIYDNFFDLGGHSLLSPQVMHQIETRLRKRLNVSELILQNLAQVSTKCDQAPAVDPAARGVLRALRRIIASD
ncbi:MAG TPA: amino acid adenylation domain-containing protein [Polyangia bacterium]